MSAASWQRGLARRLVRHAAKVLRPAEPSWSAAMEMELEHIPKDSQALAWAFGCLRASYTRRYFKHHAAFLAAVAVGVAYAFADELLSGVLAARPYPRWYVAFARAHKHLSLELWFSAQMLPSALLAGSFGVVLARLAKGSSTNLPLISLGVWVLYALLPLPGICNVPLGGVWESFRLWPISSIARVVVPSCALVFGYRLSPASMQ